MLEQKDLQSIAELINTGFSQFEETINTRISQTEETLNSRISQTEDAFNSRISQTEDALNSRISQTEDALNSRISQTEDALNSKIFQTEELLVETFAKECGLLENRIEKVERNLEELNQYYKITKLENDNTTLLLKMITDLQNDVNNLKSKSA